MKTQSYRKWVWAAAIAALPLMGCTQRTAYSASAEFALSNQPAPLTPAPVEVPTELVEPAIDPAPEELATNNLETASGRVVSTPETAIRSTLSYPAREVVKLAQAGVDEGVMLAFVTNSTLVFGLTSDDIIYLNDLGVPESVVTAMLQRDQVARSDSAVASAPPVYTNQADTGAVGAAPIPYAAEDTSVYPEQTVTAGAQYVEQPAGNVAYTYFYDALAPYGTWIEVDGYGLCWQPTVVVVNRDWHPYFHRGRWLYTDYGWYWASDYSWGWAPFHYGRWFRHYRWGWCWAPDTVWGPAWVSWRYTTDYCGWAPLPPTACYRPGFGFTWYGRSVGFSFTFGLSAHHFVFIPTHRFTDRHFHRHRLHHQDVDRVFHRTQVANRFDHDRDRRVINRGVPVEQIARATRSEIRPVRLREVDRPTNARLEQGRTPGERTLAVFRPKLPEPDTDRPITRVGEGVRPAPRQIAARNDSRTRTESSLVPQVPRRQPQEAAAVREARRPNLRETAPVQRPSGDNDRTTTVRSERNGSLILRGPGRSPAGENPAPERPATPNQQDRPLANGREATPPAAQIRPRNNILVPQRPNRVEPAPQAPVVTPPAQQPNRQIERTVPQRPQQNQRVFPQTPQPRAITPPTINQAPRQQPPVQVPRPEPRVQQPRLNPPQQRVAPAPAPAPRIEVPRVAPRVEAPRVAPRIESRPAPRIEAPRPAPGVERSAPARSQGGGIQRGGGRNR
ncbi:MAG TPA: hypothetical protein GYA07_07260 [Verrucomicrobia bacterium]|nr:hypothetical protein [Verrucomicrobiota bacterium]HOB32036.1 hypothetical protein [Verrucomicrobiota bacterium]HOP97084.1 hypothetical protein [Verrucomicrobiota bacterium]HPU56447.1 hypothetical protein [Verrucomicrobiota bacterium]